MFQARIRAILAVKQLGTISMCHAHILDDNMAIGRAIQDRLASLGLGSFDNAWTEKQTDASPESVRDRSGVGAHSGRGCCVKILPLRRINASHRAQSSKN